MSVTAVLLI